MPKGVPNKRYTPEYKQKVVEAVVKEGLSYQEAAKLYEVNGHDRIQSWERIYLTEGPEGFTIERRGRGSTGRPTRPSKLHREQRLRRTVPAFPTTPLPATVYPHPIRPALQLRSERSPSPAVLRSRSRSRTPAATPPKLHRR